MNKEDREQLEKINKILHSIIKNQKKLNKNINSLIKNNSLKKIIAISITSGLISGAIVSVAIPTINNLIKVSNIHALLSIQNESVTVGSSHHRELVIFHINNFNNERLNEVDFSVGFPKNITEIIQDYTLQPVGSPKPNIEIMGNHISIKFDYIDCNEFASVGFLVVWQKEEFDFPIEPDDGPWLSTRNFGDIKVEVIQI